MAAVYAALVSLMNILDQIQNHSRLPISLDKNLMESLHEHVTFFIDFLESYSFKEANSLETRIADAASAAEDIVETYVVNKILDTSQTFSSCLLPGIEKVMENMKFIKEEVLMKIKDGRGLVQPLSVITENISRYIPFGKNTMVGFDDEFIQIMDQLTGPESVRQIIPIVGMGGIGKTTLAKNVYDQKLIVNHFDICAWVSMSQEYSSRQILLGVLFCQASYTDLGTFTQAMSQVSDAKLGERLYKSLCGMRYLVVMDDMWDVEAWGRVNVFFPDYNNGSRIMVTTRLSNVAAHFNSQGLIMNFLDENKSWELLCKKVFVEDGCCPIELEEVGRKIAKSCKGLPLSLVVIGGLLGKSERREEYWEYVASNTNSIISSEGNEHCMEILSLSYHSLPIHLKPCFLYMAAFPKDKEIHFSWLINLWVAEGFLKPNSSKDLEVVGEECINNLISRNLIFVHTHGATGKIKFCNMHDLLRDLCLRETQKEKFLFVPNMLNHDHVQDINRHRHISIHQSSSTDEYPPQVLNTLELGPHARSLLCDLNMVLPLENLRLLRVLKVANKYSRLDEKREDEYLLDDILHLVNSRYIAFNCIWDSDFTFPSSLCLLWNLKILIVKVTWWGQAIAPIEIWEMTELRHLDFDMLYLPDPPIHEVDSQDNATMKNLRTLKVSMLRLSDEVVRRIDNVKKMRILYQGKLDEYYLENIGLMRKLESLACYFILGANRPSTNLLSNLTFPKSLKKLTLFGCDLYSEEMSKIGSLPDLEVLKLHQSLKGTEWTPVTGEFLRLKFLEISTSTELQEWIADDTHFPCLEHLVLRVLENLVEIPSGIGDISTLQSIRLVYCTDSAVVSAKRILEEQNEYGNESILVRVALWGKNDFLESLGTKKFQVQVDTWLLFDFKFGELATIVLLLALFALFDFERKVETLTMEMDGVLFHAETVTGS